MNDDICIAIGLYNLHARSGLQNGNKDLQNCGEKN